MRTQSARLVLIVFVVLAAFGMSAAAGHQPTSRDLTRTPAPPREPTSTPTPASGRTQQPPTVIQPGRIYEGNLSGESEAKFLLNAELGQFFLLEVETDDFDSVIEVYDMDGTQVARDDDSGSGNMPQLVFIAPASAQFEVFVKAFSAPVEGSYILRASASVAVLEYGTPVTVTHDGIRSTTFSFEAERGDVINLFADTGDSIDTTMKLLAPDGTQVAYIDDFSGIDPEFRRLPLNQSGRYYVIHAPYSTSAVGDVPLTLEKTDVGTLGADPVEVKMTESSMKDVFNIEVVEGRLYNITVSVRGLSYTTVDITDLDGASYGSSSFSSTEGGSIFFRARATGTLRVTVGVSDSSGELPLDILLSIRSAE